MELYGTKEVRDILGIGKTKAQQIIRQLNDELDKKGYMTVRGKIPKRYFEERFYYK